MVSNVVKFVTGLLVLLLVSCKVEMPENILPPGKMEDILYDYHLANSMSSTFASADYKEKLMYAYVYDKHNVSKEHFDSSLAWYNRYPKYMKGVYENLEKRFQEDVDVLGGAKVLQNEGVDIDAAYLASDVAELWTGFPVKVLSSTPLNNKILFSFNTPDDSSFVAGDSLVFSFNAMFVSENEANVNQEAYAAITLEYNDDSYCVKGIGIKEAGDYAVAASRNFGSSLKSMSGYVYYFDNDTSYASRVLLDALSVKRIHPTTNPK